MGRQLVGWEKVLKYQWLHTVATSKPLDGATPKVDCTARDSSSTFPPPTHLSSQLKCRGLRCETDKAEPGPTAAWRLPGVRVFVVTSIVEQLHGWLWVG